MKIRPTNGGGWTMEHNGVEAPYSVTCLRGVFIVHDIEAEDDEWPIAHGSARHCEKRALEHFNQ